MNSNRLPAGGRAPLALALLAVGLVGCGGGGSDSATVQAEVIAMPVFDMLPVTVEPPDSDADGSATSASGAGRATSLPAGAASIDTRNLTLDAARAEIAALPARASAAAVTTTAVTYTPAQVRAAYRLPAVPADIGTLDAAGRAALGAGQTLYLVNAYHHPNIVADLAAFSSRFGLPGCTTVSVAAGAAPALPVITPASGCSFIRVTATAAGGMSATVPGYHSGWAQEIALDVQWAHALAPLARLVLVEAPTATTTALAGAITLANRLGAGVVSMSFGATEGSWATAYDRSVFAGSGMSYVAATGDSGSQSNWPAISPAVLAVGGTTLGWSGSGTRTEKAWSKSGGAASGWFARPDYQRLTGLVNMPGGARRVAADVGFNADPYSGVYVGFTPSGAARSWLAMGGTSAGAPAVAGMLASVNALRALDGKATLGKPHATLYGVAAVAGNYASSYLDVTTGANGVCAACAARAGYDHPTGLGTLNFDAATTWLRAAN